MKKMIRISFDGLSYFVSSGLMVFLFPLGSSAQAPQKWTATSTTAYAITGNIAISTDRITFQNGKVLLFSKVGKLVPFEDNGTSVDAILFEIQPADDPILLNGNRICGNAKSRIQATQLVAWRSEPMGSDIEPRTMAIFSGHTRPKASDDKDICGTYSFEAGPGAKWPLSSSK